MENKMYNFLSRIIFITSIFLFKNSTAQIEKVFVENYYISDSLDATDSTSFPLPKGSKTYRIFIDLKAGSKLRKIYGDINHSLEIKSSDTIWNNTDNGISFAYEQNKNRLGDNTVALDSWLTIGEISKSTPAPAYFGIPKINDINGSVVGGPNNDGGSMGISEGLLTNSTNWMGLPLTSHDGIDTSYTLPENWISYGIVDPLTGDDSTIFGSLIRRKEFISHNAGIQNSGTIASDSSNQLLIAQLTTLGDISFKLNIEMEEPSASGSIIKKYVSDKENVQSDETYNAFLTYPLQCGCTDFNYIEYDPSAACSDNSLCQTKIIFGCMDSTACNFDKSATYHIQDLCCYPGYCNDRNLNVICPVLFTKSFDFFLYPNPTANNLSIEITQNQSSTINYSIVKSDGTFQVENALLGTFNGSATTSIDVSSLETGLFLLVLKQNGVEVKKSFVKE